MGVRQMDYCKYCGAEVFYEEGQTLTRCHACGQTLRIAEFLVEKLRLEKALEAEQAAKQELEKVREELRAAQERLNNTLLALGDLRNSNNLQEEQLQQVVSSLDISKENQQALCNMLQTLSESDQSEHAQISALIRTVIDHQDTMTGKIEALRSFSETLLGKSDDTLALISSLSEYLHADTTARNQAISDLVAWARSAHEDDLAFLQDIQNASGALLETQKESQQKLSNLEKRLQETTDILKRFESKWEKSLLDEMIGLYHQAENLQADREYEKASDYYRQVIVKGGKDPEVLWRIVQCHYGVNCQTDNEGNSVITLLCPDLSDPAEMSIRKELENSLVTDEQKNYYHTELQKIDTILDKYRYYRHQVSYDIFISVKQMDNGHYTNDSDVGSELYTHLISKGYKVFNSRRSIPAGVEYEPYILAALLSAKVLIVVGSCPEYINSQWVKNEWSRFQWLQKHEKEVSGSSDRMLLCYLAKGMDPYTIPKALNPSYQAIMDGLNAERQLAEVLTNVFQSRPAPVPEPNPEPKPLRKQKKKPVPAPKPNSEPKPVPKPKPKPVPVQLVDANHKSSVYAVLCLLIGLFAIGLFILEEVSKRGGYPSNFTSEQLFYTIFFFAIICLSIIHIIIYCIGRKKESLKSNWKTKAIGIFTFLSSSICILMALIPGFLNEITATLLGAGIISLVVAILTFLVGYSLNERIICLSALMMYTIIILLFVPLSQLGRSISILCIAVLNIILAIVFAVILRKSGKKTCYVSKIFVFLILLASVAAYFFGRVYLVVTINPDYALYIITPISMICSGITWMVLLTLKVTITKTEPSWLKLSKMPVWIICLSALSMLAIIILTWTVYGTIGRNFSRLCVADLNIVLAVVIIIVLRKRGQKRYYISILMALYFLLASVAMIVFAIMELAGDGSFLTYYLVEYNAQLSYHNACTHLNYIQTFVSMIIFGIMWIAILFFKGTTKKTAIQVQETAD